MSAWLIDLVVYGLGVSLLVGGIVTVWRGIGVRAEVGLLSVGFGLLSVAPIGVAVGDWGDVGLVEWSARELRAPVEEGVEVVAVPEFERGEMFGTMREVGEVSSGGEVLKLAAVRRTDWVKVLRVVWGAVFLVLIGRWCWRALRWWGWCRRELREMDDGRVLRVCEELGFPHRRVWTVDGAVSPFVTGVVRARIVLAEGMVAGLSDGELEMVLRHEMAHVRRGDLWWGMVVRWGCCVFWWNPLVWVGARRLRGLVEELCDREGVGDAAGAAGYARLLLRVSEGQLLGAGGVAMAGSGVGRRIGRVLSEDGWRERSGLVGKLVVVAVLVVGVGGFGVRYSSGADKEKSEGEKWLDVVDGQSVGETRVDGDKAMSFEEGFVLVFDGGEVRAGKARTEVDREGNLVRVEFAEGVRGKLFSKDHGGVVEISSDRGCYGYVDGRIVLERDVKLSAGGMKVWCEGMEGLVKGALLFRGDKVRGQRESPDGKVQTFGAGEAELDLGKQTLTLRGWPEVGQGAVVIKSRSKVTEMKFFASGEFKTIGETVTIFEKSVPITPPKPAVPAGGDLDVSGALIFFDNERGIVRWKQSGQDRIKLRFYGVEIEASSVELDEGKNLMTAEGAAMKGEGFSARAKKIEIHLTPMDGQVRMEFKDVVMDQVMDGRAQRFEAEASWYSVPAAD